MHDIHVSCLPRHEISILVFSEKKKERKERRILYATNLLHTLRLIIVDVHFSIKL